jgi:hypothetical protein
MKTTCVPERSSGHVLMVVTRGHDQQAVDSPLAKQADEVPLALAVRV